MPLPEELIRRFVGGSADATPPPAVFDPIAVIQKHPIPVPISDLIRRSRHAFAAPRWGPRPRIARMFIRKEDPLRMEDDELGARLFKLGGGPDGLIGFRLEIPEGVIPFFALMKAGKDAVEIGGDRDPSRAIWEVTISWINRLPVPVSSAKELISHALSAHKWFYGTPEGSTFFVKFRQAI